MIYCTRQQIGFMVGTDKVSARDIIDTLAIWNANREPGAPFGEVKYHPRKNALGHVFDVQVEYDSLSPQWKQYLTYRASQAA